MKNLLRIVAVLAVLFLSAPLMAAGPPSILEGGVQTFNTDLKINGDLNVVGTISGTISIVGDLTIPGDLFVDGGDIGLTTDPDLLQFVNGALTVNGTGEFNGNIMLEHPGVSSDSRKIFFYADTAAQSEIGSIYVAQDVGIGIPGMIISVPDIATGVETPAFAILSTVFGFAVDDTMDIGGNGIFRPKDIWLSGNLSAQAGYIVAEHSITSNAGSIFASAGSVNAGTWLKASGDLIIDGGEIGLTGDLDLMQIAVDSLTVNGACEITSTLDVDDTITGGADIEATTTVTAGTGVVVTTGTIATSGEAAPDVDSGGICLNQGANDAFIQTFKSSDIAHGVTSLYETDTYGAVEKEDDAKGGIKISGIGDATAARAIELFGVCGTCTGSRAGIVLNTFKKSGASITSLADAEIIVTFANANTGKIYFYGNGDLSTLGDLSDVLGDVRMIYPVVSAADPAEPFDCTAAVLGRNIIVDDTDDGTNQVVCVCLGVDDVINYEWQRADDNATICPSLP